MNKKRPVNLNLLTIRFPIPAIVSILHRLSGVFLFLLYPLLLWAFGLSLTSESGFDAVQGFFSSLLMKILLWLLLAPLCMHLVAGLRHLLMDMHIGEELVSGRRAAKLTLVITGVLVVMLGVWLW